MTNSLNNPQRTARLLDLTDNLTLSWRIVAESNERDLAVLDRYLEGPPERLLFIGDLEYWSICQINREAFLGNQVIVLDYISGMSPMNWDQTLWQEARSKYDLSGYDIYMRNTLMGQERLLSVDF